MEAAATVHGKGNNLTVTHGADTDLFVEFYFNQVAERDFVRIRFPGDTKTELDREVKDQDKERFYRKWELYQKQLSQYGTDTMLEDAGFLRAGEIEILNKAGIKTAKELAALTDNYLATLGPGAREMSLKAKRFVQSEAQEAKHQALLKENYALNNRIATQESQMKEMQEKLAALSAMVQNPPANRGRPKKVKNDDSVDSTESL